jgi:glucoside 3-dehydrogenase (cytochrome c) hitch-hiker subunit
MTADEPNGILTRREAIRRVSALLGGVAFVGGTTLLTACERRGETAAVDSVGSFSPDDVAFFDEIADTILPETSTPGAKAAKTGAFMALMVTDTYDEGEQQIFREGMRKLDEESRTMHRVGFMQATPQQRLALLEKIDRDAKTYTDARDAARAARTRAPKPAEKAAAAAAEAQLPGQRQEGALGADAGAATAITADAPSHYFRMMKELAMLGYFTSEIGCTQAQRYAESPGRFDPCVQYTPGEKAWAPHA